MGKIGKMQRQVAKQWMQGISEGKDPISDQERQAGQQADAAVAAKGIEGQQALLNQNAMAQTGGAPVMAGQLQQSAQDIGASQQDAAVKRQAEGNRMMAALREKRMAQGLSFAQNVRAQSQAATGMAVDAALGVAGVGAKLLGA